MQFHMDAPSLSACSPPSALHSWPAHTLAVTGLWAGAGGANAFAATVSLDHSCHLYSLATGAHACGNTHWTRVALPVVIWAYLTEDMQQPAYHGLPVSPRFGIRNGLHLRCHQSSAAEAPRRWCKPCAGEELTAFQLPAPLHCVATDPGEHALYLGGGDGRIFEVSLLHGGSTGGNTGGNGGGSSRHVALEGHSEVVTALALTADGTQLVSGASKQLSDHLAHNQY